MTDVVLISTEDGLTVTPLLEDIVLFTQANTDVIVEVASIAFFPFLKLTDVPVSYAGKGTQIVRVKADETGLEFVDQSIFMDNGSKGNSLNAVVATGDGTALDFVGVVRDRHSMRVTYTSNPSAVIVDLYGLLDDWFLIGTWDLAGDGRTSGSFINVYNVPAIKTRATLRTLTGGTTPAVTAYLASK